jgi:hypothetical protein
MAWVTYKVTYTRSVEFVLQIPPPMSKAVPTNPKNIVISLSEANFLKKWVIGMILSAFVYGGMLFLSLSYIPLFLKTSNNISRRMRNFLLAYVTFMVATSTIYIITMSIALLRATFDSRELVPQIQKEYVGCLCIIFASWGADGFMVSNFI